MQPSFEYYHPNSGALLLCPHCGGNYLHHEREVFERNEDRSYGIHASVGGGSAMIDTSLEGNPSLRRHGISIHFSCELCSAKPVLTIAQHKGQTFMDFIVGEVNQDENSDAPFDEE